jgi:hypothetical protein
VLIIRRINCSNTPVYVTLCRWPSGMQVRKELPDLHTRRCIDIIDSPDDEHEVARNM